MAAKTMSTRLAYGSLVMAVATFVGPGFHVSSNPQAPRESTTTEAGMLGIFFAVVAITLAVVALKGIARQEDTTGEGAAKWALAIAIIGGIIWIVAFTIRATT